MQCPDCKKFVSPFDEKCSNCGAELKENPAKNYTKKADEIIGKAETRADDVLSQMRSGFKENSSYGGIRSGSSLKSRNIIGIDTEDDVVGGKSNFNREEVVSGEDNTMMQAQIINWQLSYLPEMIHTIFSNPNILENPAYQQKAAKINLAKIIAYGREDVNGHARLLNKNEIEETEGQFFYEISIYEGYLNFAYAIAGCIIDIPGKLGIYDGDLLKKVVVRFKERKGKFGLDDLISVLPHNRQITEIGPNASAAVFQCFAHELGHICYDHVHTESIYEFRTSITNLEREHHADGFARMIIDRSQFREQLWKGYIQYQIAIAAMTFYQPAAKLYDPQTHPERIDRLIEGIRRFPDLSGKYGIDEAWAEETVNKIYKWLN